MGVKPAQVADLLALKGDTIDNIPGAPGIGEKGAKDLIVRFGSVENALEHAAEVERKMYRESLQNNREQILLSKRLATIHCDVPVPFELETVKTQEPDLEGLRELYKTLEFSSLLRELAPAAKAAIECDYQRLDPGELDAWLASLPPDAPVAVASGEMMSETVLAFSATPPAPASPAISNR
jgi:DNA polymerase-1